MGKGISRRDFIVGGGVFGASVAAVGLAGCAPSNGGLPSTGADASGTSANKGEDRPLSSRLVEVDERDVTRTEECDVVVCGSGSAGTYAAIRAAELGARVIWLEKT
ncbi:FAD-dependent oxidoreductase, partial [Adlercreutzia equolifaciens]